MALQNQITFYKLVEAVAQAVRNGFGKKRERSGANESSAKDKMFSHRVIAVRVGILGVRIGDKAKSGCLVGSDLMCASEN